MTISDKVEGIDLADLPDEGGVREGNGVSQSQPVLPSNGQPEAEPSAARASRIMESMGIPASATGEHVARLHASLAAKVERGLRHHSGGTWAPGAESLAPNERARAVLAFHWEIEHGHSHRVRCFEPPWGWTTHVMTMRRTFAVRWRRLPAYLADQFDGAAYRVRVWWDRKVLKLRNPFVQIAPASGSEAEGDEGTPATAAPLPPNSQDRG